jgi:hypothetical protein
MDVGLNNKNMFDEFELKDIDFLVQANSNERFNLWLEYSNSSKDERKNERVDWKQINTGFMITIGSLDSRPVAIEFSFAIIKGKKIAFYTGCSQVVDHKMIDEWLISRFQRTHDNYSRWNHVDAINFHNCINSLEILDIEPRNTVYEK